MKSIAQRKERNFLKDHPPVLKKVILTSTGEEAVLIAGNVICRIFGSDGAVKSTGVYAAPGSGDKRALLGILAEDVTIPAEGDAYAQIYVHAEVIADELIWPDGVSVKDKQAALAELRNSGIYAGEE